MHVTYRFAVKSLGYFFLFALAIFQIRAAADEVEFYHGRKVKPGEYLIKLKNPVDPTRRISSNATQKFFDRAASKHKMSVKQSYSGISLHHMTIDLAARTGRDADDLISEIKAVNPEISYMEPNYIVDKQSTDPAVAQAEALSQSYDLSQALSVVGTGYGLTTVPIQAQNTWTILSAVSPTVTVAVIDTGIDFGHTSLTKSIWTNTGEIPSNGIDDDRNGYIDDVHGWNFVAKNNLPQDDDGHGTHVSGIAVGVGSNIFQAATSTTTIQIMPLKFLNSTGSGATSDAINAVYYAANNGARVMNNSWGGSAYSMALLEAIAYAYSKDSVFVAAAGNSSLNIDSSPNYPAGYSVPNVIAVAATDSHDSLAGFSNYGGGTVGLSSPGVNVFSTWPGSTFAYLSGTSMATPFVSGTAALMRYQTSSMNSYQIKNLVLQGVDRISSLSSTTQSGGRVNVYSSVNLAMNSSVNAYAPPYSVSLNPNDRELAGAISGMGGGGCGSVMRIENGNGGVDEISGLKKMVVTGALMLLPLFLIQFLREERKVRPEYKRAYERFSMDSKMVLKLGDKELVGAVKTISVGGTEINTSALLKNGSVINMVISSPDGRDKIEVQGHVVWSESQKRYGVAFDNVTDSIKSQILQWQQALSKAS